MNHTVTILFGIEKDVRKDYELPNAEAMRWFMRGIEEGVGWLDFSVLPTEEN